MFQNICDPTEIETIKTTAETLRITPGKGTVEIESLSFQGKIRILSSTGESVQTLKLKNGKKSVFSLPAGIYIIKADRFQAYKIAVK